MFLFVRLPRNENLIVFDLEANIGVHGCTQFAFRANDFHRMIGLLNLHTGCNRDGFPANS
jgi:hypothetical protein